MHLLILLTTTLLLIAGGAWSFETLLGIMLAFVWLASIVYALSVETSA